MTLLFLILGIIFLICCIVTTGISIWQYYKQRSSVEATNIKASSKQKKGNKQQPKPEYSFAGIHLLWFALMALVSLILTITFGILYFRQRSGYPSIENTNEFTHELSIPASSDRINTHESMGSSTIIEAKRASDSARLNRSLQEYNKYESNFSPDNFNDGLRGVNTGAMYKMQDKNYNSIRSNRFQL